MQNIISESNTATFRLAHMTQEVQAPCPCEDIKSHHGIRTSNLFRYDVDKSSSTWIVTFLQLSFVRMHPSPNYYPYLDRWFQAHRERVEVKRGQWLEARIDGRWSRLSDADNR